MPRFFLPTIGENPVIEGPDASHIVKSLRMRPGVARTVSDEKGTD